MQKLFQRITNYFQNLSRPVQAALAVVFVLGIIGIFLQLLFPDRPPVVTDITPAIEFGVPENSSFTISFGTVLSQDTKNKLSFKVTPPIGAKTYWLENNYQYYFQLTELMENNSEHTIQVFYKNSEIFSHTFVTSEFSAEEQREHIREQSEADYEFGQAVDRLRTDLPWYDDIPIDNEQFTVMYDYDREEFRIRLKVPESTDAEIRQNLENKALSAMEAIDIDPAEWGYYVLYIQ